MGLNSTLIYRMARCMMILAILVRTISVSAGNYPAHGLSPTRTMADPVVPNFEINHVLTSVIDEADETIVKEGGIDDRISVVLTSAPAVGATVNLSLSLSNRDRCEISHRNLVFNETNWNVAQEVTVSAVDDDVYSGSDNVSLYVEGIATNPTGFVGEKEIEITCRDNDVARLDVVVDPALSITEGDAVASTFVVKLSSQPVGDIVIDITSNKTDQATPEDTRITLNETNWKTGVTIPILVTDDDIVDGDHNVEFLVVIDEADDDISYLLLDDTTFSFDVLDDDVADFTIAEAGTTINVDEGGAGVTLHVQLTARPLTPVVLSVANDHPEQASLGVTEITFAPDEWNVPHEVTLTPTPEGETDGDTDCNIAFSVIADRSDDSFDAIATKIMTVTIIDDDVPEILVTDKDGAAITTLNLDEDDVAPVLMMVSLATPPKSNVQINIGGVVTGQFSISPSSTLTFSPANWNRPQNIHARVVDNFIIDGTRTATLTYSVDDGVSDDSYDAAADKNITINIADNDHAGFNVVPNITDNIVEGGATRTYNLALTARPESDVVVGVKTSNGIDSELSVATLTFTPTNWFDEAAHSVVVSAIDDELIEGDEDVTITFSIDAAVSDDLFDAVADQAYDITIEDNDEANFTISTDNVTVKETGDTWKEVKVKLNGRPTTNVVLVMTQDPDPSDEVTFTPNQLTFTPDEWNVEQTITITALDESIDDGNQTETLHIEVDPLNSDPLFGGVVEQTVAITIEDDDTADFVIADTDGNTTVNETGSTDEFRVRLTCQPIDDVTIDINNPNAEEITLDKTQLVFNSTNWNVEQVVTVTGVDDISVDGNQTIAVELIVNDSSDDKFDGATHSINVINEDDDIAGITVAATGADTRVIETAPTVFTASTDNVNIQLSARPLTNVVLLVATSDDEEMTVSTASGDNKLTFTPDNWNVDQVVTVTSVNDFLIDGEQTSDLTVTVIDDESNDHFDGIDATAAVITEDDDVASFLIAESEGDTKVAEPDGTDEFTIVLLAQPESDVVFSVTVADASVATTDLAKITFTPTNWNRQQQITVTATDNPSIDGTRTTDITMAVVAGETDAKFQTMASQNVTVNAEDDDKPGIIVIGDPSVSEDGDEDNFQIRLTAQPKTDVVINFTVADDTEVQIKDGAISTSNYSLTFTPANWSDVQNVGLIGVDDTETDGDIESIIRISVDATSDADFVAEVADIDESVTTIDNEAADFIIAETDGGTAVSEPVGVDRISVTLTSQPLADVVVDVVNNSIDQFSIDEAKLTFTPANWNVGHVVTITAIDNHVVEADFAGSITLNVNDGESHDAFDDAAEQIITVDVADDDHTPIITAGQEFVIAENSVSTEVGTVVATDDDVPTAFSDWAIVENHTVGGVDFFVIDVTSGVLSTTGDAILDREANEKLTIKVSVSDGFNTSLTEVVTIKLDDVNEFAPVVTAGQTANIAENSAAGTSVITLIATDDDVTKDITGWQIVSGNTDDAFQIDPNTGEITINNAAAIDFETNDKFTLNVKVSDSDAKESAEESVVITIDDVHEPIEQIITFAEIEKKIYGDDDFELNVTTSAKTDDKTDASGIVFSYSCSDMNVATVIDGTVHITGVGSCDITVWTNGNYDYLPGKAVVRTLVVGKRALTVKANDMVKKYGQAVPEFTASFDGLVPDEKDGLIADTRVEFSCEATVESPVGDCAIDITKLNGDYKNYDITIVSGVLTIDPAPLVITAVDKQRKYGAENPELTLSYEGFTLEESVSTMKSAPMAVTDATVESDAKEYEIRVEGGVDNNYEISRESGVLKVDKAQLQVKVKNHERVYKEENPEFTFEYEGFKNSDTEADLDNRPVVRTDATIGSDVGEYDIYIEGGEDNNYTFEGFVPGKLIINKAPQEIFFTLDEEVLGLGNTADLIAKSTSGLPVVFISSNPDVVRVDGELLKPFGIGEAQIMAFQDGNKNYLPAEIIIEDIRIEGANDLRPSVALDPVPCYNTLNVRVNPMLKGDVTVEIVTIQGVRMFSETYTVPNPISIDVSNLKTGSYILVTRNHIDVVTTRFIRR